MRVVQGTNSDWRLVPPRLISAQVTLREVRPEDHEALCAELSRPEVSRFLVPPPADAVAFERFVSWAVRRREAGLALYLTVFPAGYERAAGVMTLHALGPVRSPSAWNWGFAIGVDWWGTGLFQAAADLTLAFAFGPMRLDRLEAWSPVANGRAHGALDKLGAAPEVMPHGEAPDGRRGTYIRWVLRRDDPAIGRAGLA